MYLIVEEFKDRLKTNRNYANCTAQTYCRALVLLDNWIQSVSFYSRGVDIPSTIELEDIEEFANQQRIKWKDIRTVNNYLAWIRAFLKFCTHKWLDVLDYRRILFAKEPDRHVNALDSDSMEKLIKFMRNDQSKDEITRMRDYAMVLVFNYCGLRVSELCKLRVQDIQEKIHVMWKWQSTRLVYLYSDYVKVIQLYLFLRRKLKINSDYVFVSHANGTKWHPLSRVSVEKIIKDASKRAWIEHTRPHKLRHTCATQMLENWGELIYISQILWHKNITTTQTYLDYSNERLKNTQKLIPIV